MKRSAFLYAAPDASAERARDPWSREHAVRLGPFWPMRYLGERDGFVQVATLPSTRRGDHCYGTPLSGLDLRLYVRTEDIAPVVARRTTKSFPDGASVTLVPGVGLTPRGRNQYDAHVPGATVRLTLEPDEVARRYRPGDAIEIGRMVNALLAPGGRLDLARNVRLAAEPPSRRARRSRVVDFTNDDGGSSGGEPSRATLAVEADATSGNRIRATVRTECLEATGYLRARDLTTDRPARSVRDVGRRGQSLRPGAALYWPDGSPAGRASERAALEGDITPRGPHLCFAHPLRSVPRPDADAALTLCVDRTSVSRRR